jgi:hypothetical protein
MDRVHRSALHGGRFAAFCEAHTNFADDSACRHPLLEYTDKIVNISTFY